MHEDEGSLFSETSSAFSFRGCSKNSNVSLFGVNKIQWGILQEKKGEKEVEREVAEKEIVVMKGMENRIILRIFPRIITIITIITTSIITQIMRKMIPPPKAQPPQRGPNGQGSTLPVFSLSISFLSTSYLKILIVSRRGENPPARGASPNPESKSQNKEEKDSVPVRPGRSESRPKVNIPSFILLK
jgi:hypothetical protein